MKYSLENLIDNKNFWSYFFFVNFPLSYNDAFDMDLNSFLDDTYKNISEKIYKWSNEFTQYYHGVINDCDGYINNPTYLQVNLNNEFLKIEYHPCGIIYFINGNQIADLYYNIKKISYDKFKSLTINLDDNIKIILLPILYMDKPNKDIEILINKSLEKTYFKSKDFNIISKFVISHITNNY